MKKDTLTKFTKYLLDFLFYAGIVVTLSLPVSIRFLIEWASGDGKDSPFGYLSGGIGQHYVEAVVIYFFLGIAATLIIWELRKMFKTVLQQNAFVMDNVKSLHKMAIISFGVAILAIIRSAVYLTIAMMVVVLVFVIAGLFSEVLSRVFEEAIIYKEENDLTI